MENKEKYFLAGIAAMVGLAGCTYFYQKNKKHWVPLSWKEIGTLSKLHLYPLKSGHRIELQEAECTEFGLKQTADSEILFQMRDRSLLVFRETDKKFVSARTFPKMVLINVSVYDEDHLAVDAPTMNTLLVKIPKSSKDKEIKIRLHNDEEIYSIDCGKEAALWLSKYFLEKDSDLRLGYHDASQRRDLTKTHTKFLDYYKNLSNYSTGLYSDLSSFLLLNQSSIDDLNKRLVSSSVTAENFRPNLVIEGLNIEPYAEDTWEWIKIGNVVFRNVKECTRCILTTINPENALRNPHLEPIKTLKTYRLAKGPENSPIMGINLEAKKLGKIKIGDPVSIVKFSE